MKRIANVCRSPIAEAVFHDLLKKYNLEHEFEVDSAAITSWFVGDPPNDRALDIIKMYNLSTNNISRQIKSEDFTKFDLIFGMDLGNIRDLKLSAPADCISKIRLLGDCDPNGERTIRDPYFVSSFLCIK